jgi:hypothetical protein
MDLTQFETQDTYDYTLVAPNGERTDIVLTLAGPTHPVRAAYERKATAKGLREFNRKGKASLPDDPDEIIEQQVERLVTFTLDWKNLSIDGADYIYSPKAARELYADKRFGWIRDAVAGAVGEIANFMKGSSAS